MDDVSLCDARKGQDVIIAKMQPHCNFAKMCRRRLIGGVHKGDILVAIDGVQPQSANDARHRLLNVGFPFSRLTFVRRIRTFPDLLSAEFDRQQSAGSRKITTISYAVFETVKMLVEKIAPNDPYSAATWDRARKSQAHLLYVLDVNHKSDVDSLCLLEKYDAHAGQQCCVVGPNFDASSSLATEARARVSGGVHAGDIILSLNGRKVLSLDDLCASKLHESRNVMAFGRRIRKLDDISHFKSAACVPPKRTKRKAWRPSQELLENECGLKCGGYQ